MESLILAHNACLLEIQTGLETISDYTGTMKIRAAGPFYRVTQQFRATLPSSRASTEMEHI